MKNAQSQDKWRHHFGDRKDGRKLHDIDPMNRVAYFLMPDRVGAMNLFRDAVPIDAMLDYVHRKRKEGLKNFGLMHVFAAAYVRTVSQKPQINRFISGLTLYARPTVQMIMTVKKKMKLDGEETTVKFDFARDATAAEVYEQFDRVIGEAKSTDDEASDFDRLAGALNYMPRWLLRFVAGCLRALDYIGWVPASLVKLSPFHGSIVITSMGSLGIPPIYHHLYAFGNVPVFMAFSAVKHENELQADGSVKPKRYFEFTVSTDERICDGFYYAAAFHDLRNILLNPEVLDERPEVIEDVD